mgnify:CR=1 FL=1
MDMSFMSKFLVQGRDAGKVLNYISANHIDRQANKITYTQWLNEEGKLEADLTVTKLEEEKCHPHTKHCSKKSTKFMI